MRKVVLFLFVICFVNSSLSSQILTDSFSGMVSGQSIAGQGSWSASETLADITVTSGSLSYSGYPSSSGDKISYSAAGNNQSVDKDFSSSITSGSLYLSFLINVADFPSSSSTGRYFLGVKSGASNLIRIHIKKGSSGNVNIGISKGSGTTEWTGDLANSTTHCIVVKYTYNSLTSIDDEISLFVNPSPISSEPETATASTSDGSDGSSLSCVFVRAVDLSGTDFSVDEIRTSTSWSQAPLPVEFSTFSVKKSKNNANIEWETITEINNYGFDIQKRLNQAGNWQSIKFIQGFGNSNIPQKYFFVDKNLQNGLYFYRLKQIDLDGNFTYSETKSIEIKENITFQLSQNYPNPSNPSTTISFSIGNSSLVRLVIYDILGMKVATLVNNNLGTGYYSINVNTTNLTSGIYFYTLTAEGMEATRKMIVEK